MTATSSMLALAPGTHPVPGTGANTDAPTFFSEQRLLHSYGGDAA